MKCCFINKLFDYENIIRRGIARSIYYIAEANNKYMDDYDESKVSSRIMYFDFNNQYRWALSESLPCKANKHDEHASTLTPDYITNYGKNSESGYTVYTIIADVKYPE